MDENTVLEVTHLSKKFRAHKRENNLKDMTIYFKRQPKGEKYRYALKDISFSLKKGQMIGIIGKNGSGKSTTLKLLTKIIRPTSGTIEKRGRVACLIELGAGFHPDMTGKENIFLNASIFGIPEKVVKERFDKIVEFSGIEEFINERARTYSSGMNLRLGFAVAINVDADILLVDEILAVGDLAFQEKCLNRIREFKNNGGSIVYVSHNLQQVREFCDYVIWIDDGVIREEGLPDVICDKYEAYMKSE